MYGIINKIKELEIKKTWYIIGALFALTVGGTIFFITQKNDDIPAINKAEVTPIQVIPMEEKENVKEDLTEEQPLNEETSPTESIAESTKAEESIENEEVIMKWPGQGEVITVYGFVHSETFSDLRFHPGIDIQLPPGYEVRAALAGKVVSVSSSPLWGYEIVIKHGEKLETRYKCLKPSKDTADDEVMKGEVIGQVIQSPPYEAQMDPHLHFEVYEYDKSVDPLKYLK